MNMHIAYMNVIEKEKEYYSQLLAGGPIQAYLDFVRYDAVSSGATAGTQQSLLPMDEMTPSTSTTRRISRGVTTIPPRRDPAAEEDEVENYTSNETADTALDRPTQIPNIPGHTWQNNTFQRVNKWLEKEMGSEYFRGKQPISKEIILKKTKHDYLIGDTNSAASSR